MVQAETKNFINMRMKRFGFLCFGVYTTILLQLTLFTHNYYTYGRSANLGLFSSIRLMWQSGNIHLIFNNILGNVLLFLPFGFLMPLLVGKLRNGFFICMASLTASLLIEVSQYQFANRIFDIDDIFLNATGAMTGWTFIIILMKIK